MDKGDTHIARKNHILSCGQRLGCLRINAHLMELINGINRS